MSRYRQKHQHDYHADFQIELSHFELSSPNTLLNWTFNNLFLFFIYNWRTLNKFQRHQKLKLFLFTEEGDCAKSPADVHWMMRWESLQRLFIHEMRRTWKLRNSDASGDSLRFFKAPRVLGKRTTQCAYATTQSFSPKLCRSLHEARDEDVYTCCCPHGIHTIGKTMTIDAVSN